MYYYTAIKELILDLINKLLNKILISYDKITRIVVLYFFLKLNFTIHKINALADTFIVYCLIFHLSFYHQK